ncbi:peptidase family M28 family [Paramyrothecium foliicola]|nr:peptidase family M28 family [Paramyrothecium foliicola]
MSWRNQGITGSNNIPLGNRRRFGGDEEDGNGAAPEAYPDRDLKRGRDPEPRSEADGPRRRKKRNRWGDVSENKAAGLMGLPTAILANMTSEQLEAYTLHLRIEEISQKLRIDDVVPADGDRSPSPPPQYDNHGRRVNTREYRYRKRLEDERHKLIEKAMKTIPNYHPPQDYRRPTKTQEKVYVPVNDYPEINFIGLLIGPRGNTLKKMEGDSGAKIAIRGKGSVKEGKGRSDAAHSSNQEEDLHCLIMADTEEKVNKAKQLIHNVIETAASIPEGQNELKRNQLRELAALNGTLRDDENQACQNCGKIGHRKIDCPERQNYTASIICRVCGNAGHMARDCPDRQKGASWRNAGPGGRPGGRIGGGDAVDREMEQLMQELGGGSGAPAQIEAGPGGYNGNGGDRGGEPRAAPWQRGPTGGPAPWRSRRDNNDSYEGGGGDRGGGGAAPWARDRNRGYDNQGDSYQGQGYGGQSGQGSGAAPPWGQQAPGTQGGYPGYGGYGGYGGAPGMAAPPGLSQPPGMAAPPPGLNDLIQHYAGAAPPPPPPPSGDAPPPPPGDQPPPPPPPGAQAPLHDDCCGSPLSASLSQTLDLTNLSPPLRSSSYCYLEILRIIRGPLLTLLPLLDHVQLLFAECRNPFAFRPGPVTFWVTVVYLALFIPLIWVHETVPPAPSDHSLYRGLNLTEAWHDLQNISNTFHPFNSRQNDHVRDFLIARSVQILQRNGISYKLENTAGVVSQQRLARLGLPLNEANISSDDDASKTEPTPDSRPQGVTLFDDKTSNVTWSVDLSRVSGSGIHPLESTGHYFEGNNFYIYIHGKEDPEGEWWLTESDYNKARGKGAVLVNCHFDSVSTGYGATDDGMSCVSMLQMLSYFTSKGHQPKHGIVLLFNNAEEDGLLGARAFAQSPLVQFCHTFVNLEGAGAGGRAMLFRTTDLESAKAYARSPYPFGSVVAANAFQAGLIKSGTDYQIFADIFGQRGVDIAFYEPRARYHTEDDDSRHASVNSIWHMLSAALATTERFSEITGTVFKGDRSDGNRDLVQNGKATEGVWFDVLGRAWGAFALRGLFAWSLSLLVATPLVLLAITYILIRKNKYYFFAKDIKIHSELNDDPVRLGGWRGVFRFPLALIFAGALTIASAFLLAKINPLIIYSSRYAVWAMTISLFFFAFWLIMRGSSFVRPSALHRSFVIMWLFVLGWAFQVYAAVLEDRMHVGAFYFAAIVQTAIFLALLISLLEQFALPGKRTFANQLHDAHQARDRYGYDGEDHTDGHANAGTDEGDADHTDDDNDPGTPTETTPLRAGEQGYGADQPTFASTYRRSAANEPPAAPVLKSYPPYEHEQSWSGWLPSWTWIFQFLLLAPVPVLLVGNLALVATSAVHMTGTDGSSLLLPLLLPAAMTILLLLPVSPFIHRFTHHIPIFLLVVFVLTLIYNLIAFPFSTEHRFKFNFQQVIDLDKGTSVATLTGIEEYVRQVIEALPNTDNQKIECHPTIGRKLMDCEYDVSDLLPNLVDGKEPKDLINATVTVSPDGKTANILLDALETRMCNLNLSQPVHSFSVNGATRDPRFGDYPAEGLRLLQVWRREWEGPWNITVGLAEKHKAAESESDEANELKTRADFEVSVGCAWSDANKPSTIPAFYELKKYMPTWSVVTKRTVALVEVRKRFSLDG